MNRFAAVGVLLWVLFAETAVIAKSPDGGASLKTVAAVTVSQDGVALNAAFAELSTQDSSGLAVVNLSGLPALPNASFTTANLTPAVTSTLSVPLDPSSGNPFDLSNSKAYFQLVPLQYGGDQSFTYTNLPRFVFVEVVNPSATQVRLQVGADSNADELPESSEVLCTSDATAGTTTRCIVDLGAMIEAEANAGKTLLNAWILIDVSEGSPGINYPLTLYTAEPLLSVSTSGNIFSNEVATGPGEVAADAAFDVRLFNYTGATPLYVAQRNFGVLMVDPAPPTGNGTGAGQTLVLPFALTRSPGTDDVQTGLMHITPDDSQTTLMLVQPNQPLQHLFIDVPPNTSSFNVQTGSLDADVPFSLVRADFPQPSASPSIVAAPNEGTRIPSTLVGNNQQLTLTPENGLSAGRWYVVIPNTKVASESLIGVRAYATFASNAPTLTPGAYFNPERSGHGLFMNQASGNQAVFWFTYLEDGTPTWHLAEGPSPQAADGIWTAPLTRSSWNGSTNLLTQVGFITITTIANDQMIFSWNLEGQFGSEPFELLSPDTCPSLNGAATNVNGAWYAPAQSGLGVSVVADPNNQFDAFYLYDNQGVARWVFGQVDAFTASTTFAMQQASGFCPLCSYVPITTQTAGSLDMNFLDGLTGSYSTDLSLLPPLSGSWKINQPILRLTGSTACRQ